MSKPEDARQSIATTVRSYGQLDVLVNNAGLGATGHFVEASAERLRRIMEVNLFGLTETTRAFLPLLRTGRGRVVNMGGAAARGPGRQQRGGKQGNSRAAKAAQPPAQWGRLRDLWQLPLLVVSVALFGVAAWLFIDPKPGLSIEQKIEVARTLIAQVRPEAAIEQLNRLLAKEKLEKVREAEIHLLLAESLDLGQKQKKINIPDESKLQRPERLKEP